MSCSIAIVVEYYTIYIFSSIVVESADLVTLPNKSYEGKSIYCSDSKNKQFNTVISKVGPGETQRGRGVDVGYKKICKK